MGEVGARVRGEADNREGEVEGTGRGEGEGGAGRRWEEDLEEVE